MTVSRALVTVGVIGLTTAALALLWARQRVAKRRAAKRAAAAAAGPPSLAEEIREALEAESLEQDTELPSEVLQAEFAAAAEWVTYEGAEALAVAAQLELYGAYKQVLAGDAPQARPRGMEAGAKWDAWHRLSGLPRVEAMAAYVQALDRLAPTWRTVNGTDFANAAPHKADGSSGFGFSVSTMGQLGDPDQAPDVDDTPVGMLCEMIANGESVQVVKVLPTVPSIAFERDKDGMTPLHWAADRGDISVTRVLVSMLQPMPASAILACLNCKDDAGDTPLHFAVNTDGVELARLLCESGADPSIANDDGETPENLADGQEPWASSPGVLSRAAFEALSARA